MGGEFKGGRTSCDDNREGRLKTALTPEIVVKVQHMVLKDWRVTERDLVESLEIL